MKSLTAAEAVRLFPDLKNLLLLKSAGWVFLPVADSGKNAAMLDGAKIWSQAWRDCIRVKDEGDVLGLRIRMPADQHSKPEIVWEYTGSLVETVNELLLLPVPETRHAPNLVIGKAPRLWTP